jgi:hypothetical protein
LGKPAFVADDPRLPVEHALPSTDDSRICGNRMASTDPINLVLVYRPKAVGVEDFEQIGRRVRTIANNVNVYIQKDELPDKALLDELSRHRTLVFSPLQLSAFYLRRGCVYAGRPMQKSEQLLRLGLAGVPVPPWTSPDRGKRFDPEFWGEHVIVKPEIGSAGRGVSVHETSELNEQSHSFKPFARNGINFIVQKIIRNTSIGKMRVQLLFDEVLCCYRYRYPETLDLDTEENLKLFQKHFITFSNIPEFFCPEEIFEQARRCYRAFDGVALLALDVVLDEAGKHYFIEANPGGNTWHYSSEYMGSRLTDEGIVLEQQFGAFDRAGDVLARRALQEAI